MGAICIAYWHVESINYRGKEYAFSPCATFDRKHPIGGWILMEVFDHAQRWATWENLCGEPVPKIPKPVEKALLKRIKNVRNIKPCPYDD